MIKAIIFDYGGTIDTRGDHWSAVLWDAYQKEQIPVTYASFRQAYIYAEQQMEQQALIQPTDTFLQVLRVKIDLQTRYLVDNHYWTTDELTRRPDSEHIALDCYSHVLHILRQNRPLLQWLSTRYPLVLVSNFYGNLNAVLRDFSLDNLFTQVIESATVGIRKPNPQIFQLAINALHLPPSHILVVGDSYTNDILPAQSLGCQTYHLQGRQWN